MHLNPLDGEKNGIADIEADITGRLALTTPILKRETLYGNPEIYDGKISPDGRWLSFTKEYNGVMNIGIKPVDEQMSAAQMLTKNEYRCLDYFWTADSKFIVYIMDNNGNEKCNIYAAPIPAVLDENWEIPATTRLTTSDNANAVIYAVGKKNPDVIFVGLNERDQAWHDIYALEISTGKLTLIRENKDRVAIWSFDWNDELRMTARYLSDGSKQLFIEDRVTPRLVFETNVRETGFVSGFSADNKAVFITTNKGEDVNLTKLIRMDLETLACEDVASDPLARLDIDKVIFSNHTRSIKYISFKDVEERKVWFDERMAGDYAFLQETFPGKVIDLDACTADEEKYMIKVWSAHTALSTYIFNRKDRSTTFQYIARPDLKKIEQYLSPLKSIVYKSSDGLEIHAYLSLPVNLAPTNLPLLVWPHDGPWIRHTYNFYMLTQLMANRGFAVLQPNFRGSSGFGKDFLNGGNREWGRKMQDDLTYGVKHLIEKGIADPARVAIMGTGYGGYAALAALAFTPDLYACAIDISGPANLEKLVCSIPPFWEAEKSIVRERIGDEQTEEGRQHLRDISPWFFTDRITKPVMVVQGANDIKVNRNDTAALVSELYAQGKEVQYFLADDEGGIFLKSINNLAVMAAAEAFLSRYCGTRVETEISPAVEKRLAQITVDIASIPRQ